MFEFAFIVHTKNKFESHKKESEKKDFCSIIMLSDDTKILECNQCQKSDKAPFLIYVDLQCIIKKKSSTRKPNSIRFFNVCNTSFRSIKDKHDVYRGKNSK